jgi:regulator of replication initiation timing
MTDLLLAKLSNTQQLFAELQPRGRSKRGLFNFIGTGIKIITGNLDENDLMKISRNLQDLSHNSKALINENNEQRLINYQFQNRLNRIINQLGNQQVQISKNLIMARDNKTGKDFVVFKEIFKIHFNLDFLKSHLEDIFEAIKLAKLQILSKIYYPPRN